MKSRLFNFVIDILSLLFKKEVHDMAAVYVALIIKGVRTYSSIPNTVKAQVRQMLIDLELEYLIDEEG